MGTFVIGIILAGIVALIIRSMIRIRKAENHSAAGTAAIAGAVTEKNLHL